MKRANEPMYGKTDIRHYNSDKQQTCGKCFEHICSCAEEIPPVVLDNRIGEYRAKLEKIANCRNYSSGMIISLAVPTSITAHGLVYENMNLTLIGLAGSLVGIGITCGIAALENRSLKKNIDSLVEDYAKNQEEKQ